MPTNINDNSKLLKGYFTVCDAVSKTMGREGKLAIIENFMGIPIVTKDGVTVARNINFSDNEKEEQMGASLVKQACVKSLVENGDGTSTAACFAGAIVRCCTKNTWLGNKKYFFNKKVELGMQTAFEEVCKKLNLYSKDVSDKDLEKIASISANNDNEIGSIILKAFKAVGKNGIIQVKEGKKTELSVSKGMKINKGFFSPFLINNQKNATFQAEKAKVLVYAGYEIHDNEYIKNWINQNKTNPIVIVAERVVSEDWIREIYRVNSQAGYNITVVEAPDFDLKREAILEDIALYTNGEVFVQGVSSDVVAGEVDSVVVEQNTTSFIKETVSEQVINRISELSAQFEHSSDPDFIRERIQALEGVSATITVGGKTESELKELKDRFDDAVSAIKSAVEQGWIAGGGSTLVKISFEMNKKFDNKDIQFGYNKFKEAIMYPFFQICENANRNPYDYIWETSKTYGVGYNAHKDELSNLIEDGVIDSCKSVKNSLENAFSVSKLILNSQVIITT